MPFNEFMENKNKSSQELLLELKTLREENEYLRSERDKVLDTIKNEPEYYKVDETFRKRIFENSRIPIVVMDPVTYKCLDCNQAAAEIYGFATREETLKNVPLNVIPPTQYDGTPSKDKAKEFTDKAFNAGSYDEVLRLAMTYCDVS